MKLFAVLLLFATSAFAGDATINDVSFMSGCWAVVGGEKGSDEVWLRPAGGTMMGIGRTVRKGRTVTHEFMQIREAGGTLTFFASPAGQESAEFPLLSLTKTRVVFENKAHDFPNRVTYELRGRDELLGSIEGSSNGRDKRIEFPMKRTACP